VADNFVGEIRLFPFNFPPKGWALCQGQILSISQNTALFSLLGTSYGGNGTSNFALPDLQGRVAVAQGQGPGLSNYVIGQSGGNETIALTTTEIPSHTHTLTATGTLKARSVGGNSQTPAGNAPAAESEGATATYSSATPNASMKAGGVTFSGTAKVSTVGSGTGHENHMPVLALNYCIALQGIFPSRS
jgi:microcystin-dependent protein